MQVGRVYWVWALFLVGSLGLLVTMTTGWYGFEAETPESSQFVSRFGDDIAPPDAQLHTDFWHDGHMQLEGLGGDGGGADEFPHIAQVMSIVRIFFVLGAVGVVVAMVGVVFRLRGLPDGKGLMGSLAVVSLFALAFSAGFFAVNIPEAYNDYLETERGESPEIAFYTLGIDSENGAWENATSAPGVAWYALVGSTAALTVAFGMAYVGDVRRVKDAILHDDVSREIRRNRFGDEAERTNRVGVERFREGRE